MVETQVSIALGAVAVVAGAVAIIVSVWADRKMKAISNLDFDEKAAMMEEYEDDFRQGVIPWELEKFKWDLSALTHVARWTSTDKRARVGRMVDSILASIGEKVSKEDMERIRLLRAKLR